MSQSPTRILSESPSGATLRSCLAFVLSNARSVSGSRPTISAWSSSPLSSTTTILSAPSTTWLFVTMYPSSEITKPEPVASERNCRGGFLRGRRPKNSSKMSGLRKLLLRSVWMFTTAGDRASARSATESGLPGVGPGCPSSQKASPETRALALFSLSRSSRPNGWARISNPAKAKPIAARNFAVSH